MIDTARKLLSLFTPRERRRLLGVLAAVIVMGLLQVAGVGSIMPFVALLGDHSLVHDNAVLAWGYHVLGCTSTGGFLMFVGFVVLVLLVAANAFAALTIWLIARFAWANQRRLSARLLAGYLAQPYEVFLNRNSADTGENILFESQQLTQGVLIPAMSVIAFGVTALFIAGLLLWLNPLLAALVGVTFGTAYLLVYLLVRRPLVRIGRQRMAANTERFKLVDEAFGSLKELKVLGREADFVRRYRPAARTFAGGMAAQQVLSQLPRYAIEALAFGLVMTLFLYVLHAQGSVHSVLPLASAFALGGYRVLPALQQIYQGLSALRFNQSVLDTIHRDLHSARSPTGTSPHFDPLSPTGQRPRVSGARDTCPAANTERLPFTRSLNLGRLTYTYPGAVDPALREVSLTMPRNAFVAFVGETGSGKTTLAHVILGLLRPQSGTLTVDGVAITDANRRAWQANLGYVPQDIYLTDDTVAANIAYGVPQPDVDSVAVERAAHIANIHDFITDKLPKGYATMVGERGVRLSGGERQRIGIARALYHDPSVLVLDEATSALDNATEQRIVDELDAMRGGRTLIVIAHRLSTVRRCGRLYLLRDGRLVDCSGVDVLADINWDLRPLGQGSTAVGRASRAAGK